MNDWEDKEREKKIREEEENKEWWWVLREIGRR
jgi:hypothetical protein